MLRGRRLFEITAVPEAEAAPAPTRAQQRAGLRHQRTLVVSLEHPVFAAAGVPIFHLSATEAEDGAVAGEDGAVAGAVVTHDHPDGSLIVTSGTVAGDDDVRFAVAAITAGHDPLAHMRTP